MEVTDPAVPEVPAARRPAMLSSVWSAAASRMPGPAGQGLIAFAVYLVAFAFGVAQTLLFHLNQPAVGQGTVDPNFYVWAWRWWPYAITHGLNPLFSNQIGAPAGFDLAWVTPAPPLALVMWPVTAAFGPVTSFNLTLLLLPPVSAWATFVAARRLTGQFWPALLGGAVFGFNAYEVNHSVQGLPNVTAVALLPLMLYLVLLWRDGVLGRVGFVIWLAVGMALEFYVFSETFALMTVMWAAALVIGFAVARPGTRRTVARLAALAGVAYAGAIALISPLLYFMLGSSSASISRMSPGLSAHPVGMILPRFNRIPPFLGQHLGLVSAHYVPSNSQTSYVGIPALILLVLLVVFGRGNRIAWVAAGTFAVASLLSFGPDLLYGPDYHPGSTPLPWGAMWGLPFARSAEPSRIMVFGYLALAFAVALWLAAPARGALARAGRWFLGLLTLAFIFANLLNFASVYREKPKTPAAARMAATNQLPPFISDGRYRQHLKPGEIVVVVSDRGNAGMLFQAASGFYFRIAGGFINASLTPVWAIPNPVEDLTYPTHERVRAFRAYVKTSHIGAILVEQAWAEPWTKVFRKMGLHGTSAGGVTVYPIPAGKSG